ncbi:MAG: hypothetical protein CSA33_03940 [Desulfobulbus propionicus]|nr:MAG: hypothetical protein CSA33_03940 [Desulfobulbus propionicus]
MTSASVLNQSIFIVLYSLCIMGMISSCGDVPGNVGMDVSLPVTPKVSQTIHSTPKGQIGMDKKEQGDSPTLSNPDKGIVLLTDPGKKHLPAAERDEQDIVRINGVTYPVPEQWRGKKIAAPIFTHGDLERIPRELTYKRTALYLLPEANLALQEMARAAAADGVLLQVHSSYRSAWYQRKIFVRMLAQGRSFDDIVRYVAPPSFSEHMLGTVVDFYPSNWTFADSAAYSWLKKHARLYHFFESYPQHQPENMPWEAWHWRWFPPDCGD